MDIRDKLEQMSTAEATLNYSGSRAEGFRFDSSDKDWMLIYRDIRVIPELSHDSKYNDYITLLLMDNDRCTPGFTLLRQVSDSKDPNINMSTVHKPALNGDFLSCALWRERHTNICPLPGAFTHGPCCSGELFNYEYDLAHCIKSDLWPHMAQSCVRRLVENKWPPLDIISSIVNEGILFVPICSKQSSFEDIEWRISFSLAEKRLIHSMNHVQFLCYGLLKIFLKEAIEMNEDVKGLLCSYFMKTAVFWEISSSSTPWEMRQLLFHFWNCFHRLLHWVSNAYCPNFFIPENNMFAGKIEGENRTKLLNFLTELYIEGYHCLLRCPSLSLGLQWIIAFPLFGAILPQPEEFIDNSSIGSIIIVEGHNLIPNLGMIMRLVNFMESTSVTDIFTLFILKIWFAESLQSLCLENAMTTKSYDSEYRASNKSHYNFFVQNMRIIDRCRTDSVTHHLYRAVRLYSAGRYETVLKILERAKQKLDNPKLVRLWCRSDLMYRAAGGEHSPIVSVRRKSCCTFIYLCKDMGISELFIEFTLTNVFEDETSITLSPLILVIFLKFLCLSKSSSITNMTKGNEVLAELSAIVHTDTGFHIHNFCRAISWEILGICQQMNGDYWEACHSYLMALRQSDKSFRKASCVRLCTILATYFEWEVYLPTDDTYSFVYCTVLAMWNNDENAS